MSPLPSKEIKAGRKRAIGLHLSAADIWDWVVLLLGAVLHIARCLRASPSASNWKPGSKMSPDTGKHSLGDKPPSKVTLIIRRGSRTTVKGPDSQPNNLLYLLAPRLLL